VIYVLSGFDLGDIPHTLIKSSDITTDAMTNLELLQLNVSQVINSVQDGGFDLLSASEPSFLGLRAGCCVTILIGSNSY
jgi:hypothetical protein